MPGSHRAVHGDPALPQRVPNAADVSLLEDIGQRLLRLAGASQAHVLKRMRAWSGAFVRTTSVFLTRNTLICRMSSVGHCGDNAACEVFFGQLKRERVAHQSYRTRDEARADLFDYIERLHNPRMRRRVARQDLKFSAFFKPSVEMG